MLGKLFNLTTGAGAGPSPSPHAGQPTPTPEPVSSLESVQEDLHTRSLLYPDAQTLFQNRQDQVFPLPNSPHIQAAALASAFDYDGDLDLDMRDVRVLIMQDGISSVPASLLYDSQPAPPPPAPIVPDRPSTMGGMAHLNHGLQDTSRRVPTSPRKPSLSHTTRPVVIQPDSPQLRQSATFDRRPSLHSRSHSRLETDTQRAYREYADEISVFSSCIFGNSELLAYRGTSTKVHVLPSEQRAPDLSSLALHDGRGSLGRSSMRSSKLSQSFSSESAFPQPPTSSSSSLAAGSRSADRKRVLITRLFPVTLPNDEDTSNTMTPHSRFSEESGSSGYPFPPSYSEEANFQRKKKKAQLKQKRTPMYAIALIVNLPQPPAPPVQAYSASRSTFRGPGSYSEQDSFPSSYGSGRRVGWALATAAVGGNSGSGSGSGSGNGLGIDVSANDSAVGGGTLPSGVIGATTDLEERMDPITQHWDIIMRALTQLQTVASVTILNLLRASDVASPEPYPPSASAYARTASFSGRQDAFGGPIKAPKTNAKLVTLLPNALMDMERITREVDNAKGRIAVGLRALRVVTGQNRWGIWREEARWVSRWAVSVRDRKLQQNTQAQAQALPLHMQPPPPPLQTASQQGQDPFLYNLLTAFLSTHTDWLQALSPARYRKRHLMLQSTKVNDDSLSARTIIVSRDKIAARRLVFLLSAFLPAGQSLTNSVRVHRPSTSMSWGALSQSPPASFVVPSIKEQSLRRKINRRGPGGSGRRSSHSRNLSLQGQAVSGGIPTRSASMSVTGVPAPLAHLNLHRGQHERRPSDTSSIRTANLPFTGNDFTTRKSSAATMTTVTSDATVPHFATMQRSESSFSARPGSSASSAAADDLKRTLQRGDSSTSQHGSALLALQQQQQQQQGLGSPGLDSDPRNQSLRWGSMLTGFLSGRRRDSTSSNTGGGGGGRHSRNSSITSWDPLGRRNSLLPPPSPSKPQHETHSRQGSAIKHSTHDGSGPGPHNEESIDPHTPRLSQDSPSLVSGSTFAGVDSFRRAPDPNAVFDSPVKATANADDGVIDVDIAFPDYIRSFETAVSSPSSSGFLSTPGFGSGLDAFEQSCRVSVDGDLPANVAGWLQNYHPDFCLQAIPPQGNLMAQIKESLRTEPSPSGFAFEPETSGGHPSTAHMSERWVDISSAIVVDTAKLTITRVSYSRLVRSKVTPDVSTPNSANGPPTPATATMPATIPAQEMQQLDERFIEEPIVSTDSVLTKAIERVIAQGVAGSGTSTGGTTVVGSGFEHLNIHSGDSTVDGSGISTDNSARSSRSTSIRRGRRDSSSIGPDDPYPPSRPRYVNPSPTAPYSPLTPLGLEEVPRAECKTVILSALEEIVRDVVQSKDKDDQGDDGPGDQSVASASVSKDDTDKDNKAKDKEEPSVLRSAVQSWLENVDMGEV